MRRHVARLTRAVPVILIMLTCAMPAAQAAVAGSAPAAAARPTELHGHERFRLVGRSATARRQRLRATGVLDTRGHALVGRIIHGRARDWLVVRHGAIRLIIFVKRVTVAPPKGCRFAETLTGTYQIHGGARRYASARGFGTFVSTITGRLAWKTGHCTATIAYFLQVTVTSGSMRW